MSRRDTADSSMSSLQTNIQKTDGGLLFLNLREVSHFETWSVLEKHLICVRGFDQTLRFLFIIVYYLIRMRASYFRQCPLKK